MTDETSREGQLAEDVRAMYNAHPFPNRQRSLPSRSDERFKYIYESFLNIPISDLSGRVFLDAGCGTGENTWSWRRLLSPTNEILAVDLSETSVNIARSRGVDQARQPHFSVGSLLDLGLASESVDVVFCSGVLVAVTEPDRAYRQLVRVLKPGGYLILVLYHKYGRAIHGLQRAVIDLLEKEDVDRRAQLGGKLFGRRMRKLAEAEGVPLEGVLYDQFGLPCETRYSVGQALEWFQQGDINYLGSWPPVEWSHFGKALRFSHRLAGSPATWYQRLLRRIFPEAGPEITRPPGFLTRLTMETVWALDRLQLFAISGRKRIT